MKLQEIQIALFAAYDIRNALTTADKKRQTENDNFGDSLTAVIDFLENLEKEMTA